MMMTSNRSGNESGNHERTSQRANAVITRGRHVDGSVDVPSATGGVARSTVFMRLNVIRLLAAACCVLLATSGSAATNYAANLASLLDPAKLARLGPRSANPRVQKAVYWLATARRQGQRPEVVLDGALEGRMSGEAAKRTQPALLRIPSCGPGEPLVRRRSLAAYSLSAPCCTSANFRSSSAVSFSIRNINSPKAVES